MNLADLSTQLLFTTVPIWTQLSPGQETRSATAFFYSVPVPGADGTSNKSVPLLVTSHHVVQGATRGVIELVEGTSEGPTRDKRIRAELNPADLTRWVNQTLDLAAIPVGSLFNQLQNEGRSAFFRSVNPELVPSDEAWNDLAAMEDIVFIGYPLGLRDEKNANPLIRRGITSTPVWNDFQNQPVFLIDAGVVPGSSGSPVFILNQGAYATKEGLTVGSRLLFLGVISQAIVRSAVTGETYVGLGKVVRSSAVKAFLGGVVDQLLPKA